jgi:hypothetical protein
MASETQFQEPAGTIVERGQPDIFVERTIETVANVYPGRELAQGTDEQDVIVNSGVKLPIGYASYELTSDSYRKDETSTIYTALDKVVVTKGSGHVYMASIPASTIIDQGDLVVNWGAGQVYPAAIINGKTCVKIPFTGSDASTRVLTGCTLVTTMCVGLPQVYCTTFVTSGTIDIGIGDASQTGHNVIGFADTLPIAAAGFATHVMANTTSTTITPGTLVMDGNALVANEATSRLFVILSEPGYIVSTATAVDYTPSSVGGAYGFIFLPVSHPHLHIIGKCVKAKNNSASTSSANVLIQRVF